MGARDPLSKAVTFKGGGGIKMAAECSFRHLPGTGDWVMVLADPPWHGLKAGQIATELESKFFMGLSSYGKGWSSTQTEDAQILLVRFPIKEWDDPSPKKNDAKNHGLNPVSPMTFPARKPPAPAGTSGETSSGERFCSSTCVRAHGNVRMLSPVVGLHVGVS